MNNLSLEIQAKETHEKAVGYYKATEQFAFKFFMQIKKIRDNRYFEELGFSSFEDYCKHSFNLTSQFVNQKIQIADVWGEDSETRVSEIGHKKSLILARLPEPEREEFIESNPVDEMTTRQLQQAIKEKKELERQLQEEKSKPPEIKEKEVIPSDYESSKAKLKESEKKQEELKSKIEVLQSRVGDIEKYKGEVRNIKTKKDELNNEISNLYAELSKLKQETSIEEAHRKNIARISTLIRIGNEQKKKHMTELDQISREVKDLPGITKKHIHNELEVLYKYTEIIENLLNQTTVEVLSYE